MSQILLSSLQSSVSLPALFAPDCRCQQALHRVLYCNIRNPNTRKAYAWAVGEVWLGSVRDLAHGFRRYGSAHISRPRIVKMLSPLKTEVSFLFLTDMYRKQKWQLVQ
jgi:hypothetical protein